LGREPAAEGRDRTDPAAARLAAEAAEARLGLAATMRRLGYQVILQDHPHRPGHVVDGEVTIALTCDDVVAANPPAWLGDGAAAVIWRPDWVWAQVRPEDPVPVLRLPPALHTVVGQEEPQAAADGERQADQARGALVIATPPESASPAFRALVVALGALAHSGQVKILALGEGWRLRLPAGTSIAHESALAAGVLAGAKAMLHEPPAQLRGLSGVALMALSTGCPIFLPATVDLAALTPALRAACRSFADPDELREYLADSSQPARLSADALVAARTVRSDFRFADRITELLAAAQPRR
jgi:hypothetical protein